jgi:hypothetical protein
MYDRRRALDQFAWQRDDRKAVQPLDADRFEFLQPLNDCLVRLSASGSAKSEALKRVKSIRVREIAFDHVEHMADGLCPDQVAIHGASRHGRDFPLAAPPRAMMRHSFMVSLPVYFRALRSLLFRGSAKTADAPR